MQITFDQYSNSLKRASGPVTLDEAKQIIAEYISSQKEKYESDQEPFAFSIFSFSRDKRNFIEIAIDSKNEYRIKLECQQKNSFSIFSWKSRLFKEYHITTKDELNNLVEVFYNMEIDKYKEYFSKQPFKIYRPR